MGKTSFSISSTGPCSFRKVLVKKCPRCGTEAEFDFSNGETGRWSECRVCGQWIRADASELVGSREGGLA